MRAQFQETSHAKQVNMNDAFPNCILFEFHIFTYLYIQLFAFTKLESMLMPQIEFIRFCLN